MSKTFELLEIPKAENMYMLAGWRQWADAGSVSSGLPEYLIQQTKAKQIGYLHSDPFYLFQFPGTHDLLRPVVKFNQGYPEALEVPKNELYYSQISQTGIVIFLGDEPHLNVESYSNALLEIAQTLKVKRVVGFGGVYGELPYDQERLISSAYSLPALQTELDRLAVNFSNYQGGASIGSYLCRRAGEVGLEYVTFYAFVPMYDFSGTGQLTNTVRIEHDYMAWLGIIRRLNYMLKLDLSLTDLEQKSKKLIRLIETRLDELDNGNPQLGVREHLKQISENFTEMRFDPLEDVWEQELNRLISKFGEEET